jgi:hypothetical protein
MSSFATIRTSLAHSQQPSAAATKAVKSLFLQQQGSNSQRYLSTTTSSFATFARPCSIITPASTIRYRQETAPSATAQQSTKRTFSLFSRNSSSSDTLAAAKAEEASRIPKAVQNDIPEALLHETHPKPMLDEFMGKKRLTTKDLEAIPIDLQYHREPANVSDWVAYQTVKAMRIPTDIFFRTKYIHRVVALETVAAVVCFFFLFIFRLLSFAFVVAFASLFFSELGGVLFLSFALPTLLSVCGSRESNIQITQNTDKLIPSLPPPPFIHSPCHHFTLTTTKKNNSRAWLQVCSVT